MKKSVFGGSFVNVNVLCSLLGGALAVSLYFNTVTKGFLS